MANELATTRQLTPESWGMVQSVAHAAYVSRKFGVTEGEAAIKMLFCYENGLPLTAANTGLYIVNGKLAAESNIIAAQIRKHPQYDYRIDRHDNDGCTVTILRRNQDGEWKEIGESTFTKDDAETAGLADKDTYRSYPRNLFFARAITNAQRWFCPDIFSQPIYTREELGEDVVDADWTVTEIESEPVAETAAPITEPNLPSMVEDYGAEAVMAANDGQIPGSHEELVKVWEVLHAGD